jgi:hypothetical protein
LRALLSVTASGIAHALISAWLYQEARVREALWVPRVGFDLVWALCSLPGRQHGQGVHAVWPEEALLLVGQAFLSKDRIALGPFPFLCLHPVRFSMQPPLVLGLPDRVVFVSLNAFLHLPPCFALVRNVFKLNLSTTFAVHLLRGSDREQPAVKALFSDGPHYSRFASKLPSV